jgi:general secretion pathway protein E
MDLETPLTDPPIVSRRRLPEPKPDPIPVDSEFSLSEPLSESRRPSRDRQNPKPAKVEPKPEPIPDNDEDDEEPVAEKKGGGFFGFFRRTAAQEDELSPHLQELHDRSSKLRKESFTLDKIKLIGSRRQELPVVGHADSGDGIQTLGLLVMIAYQTRSTDIHLDPKVDSFDARMRVDGMLVPVVQIPRDVAGRVAGVVKVLCEIDFAGQLGIQEGSFSATAPGRRTDFRVSFTPSIHGQKLAIRILDAANSPQSLADLGAPKSLISRLNNVMLQNAGMILVCGPTGSGKTTTLYSLLRSIDRNSRNVMTIEDPVEYQIEGVTQSSVDAERGKNFSDMLRALLRQDPDVLLLGEIRDAESARISMQATMTGHLVLSTVHAQDTINTVFRLLDLGADPNLVASSLNMVLAQRLVRVLCTQCRRRRPPSTDEKRKLGELARDYIYDSAGCGSCLGTGYLGRRALFELLETNDRLKDVMLRKPTLTDLKAAVKGSGFVTLRRDGARLVAQGITTFPEVDRVIGLDR